MPSKAQLKSNIWKIFVYLFFRWFLIVIPILVPFFKSKGLSMQEVFEVQAFFAFAVALFEFPSGYLADLWGRKNALCVGGIFSGLGFSTFIIADGYWMFAVAEILLGIGISMASGTDLSILYDTLLQLDDGKKPGHYLSWRFFAANISEATASLLGGLLVLYSVQTVVWAQAVAAWFPFLIGLTLVEPPIERMEKKSHLANLKSLFYEMFRKEKIIQLTVTNNILWSCATFFMIWVYQDHWQNLGVPLSYFGVIWASYSIVGALSGKFAIWFESKFGVTVALATIGLFPILGYFFIARVPIYWSILCGFLFYISRGFKAVLIIEAMNSRIEPKYRASINSFASFGLRLMFCIFGPLMGYGIDNIGLANVLTICGIVFTAGFIGFLLPLIIIASKSETQSNPST